MAKNEEFEHESIQDNQTIGTYLESLVEGFKKGKIVLTAEKQEIELHPNNILHFDLSAKKKGNKSKMTIRLSWRRSDLDEDTKGDISIA
ncbi:MAG: amphi-Trp domain-containing protein [Proteobacteria bacterium]|nr:amphi-Trp domain-containing protein [Pseudomonadota bacterium]